MKAKKRFDAIDLSRERLDKSSSCEVLFATCFISELIQRSFPHAFVYSKQSKYMCLESRMRNWNFLSSLLSIRGILDESILIKSIMLILENFDKQNKSYHQETADTSAMSSQDGDVIVQHYTKQFHHCFVQGML